jgi:hypothetical protein
MGTPEQRKLSKKLPTKISLKILQVALTLLGLVIPIILTLQTKKFLPLMVSKGRVQGALACPSR